MFRLSDSTRRKTTLGLFFAFCVVPTVIVLALAVWQNRPGHLQVEADRLGRLLGRKVTLGGVERPRPNETVYHELTVSDPESGKSLFHCRRFEARCRFTEDQRGQRRPCLMLIASQTSADADELMQFRRLVDRLLCGGTAWSGIDLKIAVSGELALFTGSDPATGDCSLSLTDVGGHVVNNAEGTLAEIWFRQADPQMPDRVRISLQRRRQTAQPETHLRIDTGRSLLPTFVLSLGLEQFGYLGSTSRFCGVVNSRQTVDGSSGSLSGYFEEVDLDSLVSGRFDHRLGGKARLGIESARFSQGRLVDASGWLASGPGLVSRSLLDAARESFGAPHVGPPGPRSETIRYDRLALSFAIDSNAVKLQGQSPTAAIMTDSIGPLLGPLPISTHPVASLIELLFPNDLAQVPATRQTERLMSRLPLPEARQAVNR